MKEAGGKDKEEEKDKRLVHSDGDIPHATIDVRPTHSEGEVIPLSQYQIFEPTRRSKEQRSQVSSADRLYTNLDEIVDQRQKFDAYRHHLLSGSRKMSKDPIITKNSTASDLDEEIRQQLAISRPKYETAIKEPLMEIRKDVEHKQRTAKNQAIMLRLVAYLVSLFIVGAGVAIMIMNLKISIPVAILAGLVSGAETVTAFFKLDQKAGDSFHAYLAYARLKDAIYEFYLDPPDDTEQLKAFMKQIHAMHENAAQGFFDTLNLNASVSFNTQSSNLEVKKLEV